MEYLPALVLTVFGGCGLLLRWRKGRFLTAAAGWHGTLFLMYGVSGLAYIAHPVESRIPSSYLLPAYRLGLTYLAFGQMLSLAVDFLLLYRRPRLRVMESSTRTFRIAVLVSILAIFGYAGVLAGLGGSGAGTAFTVLLLFRYPSGVFLVLAAKSVRERLIASALVGVSLLFAVLSPWRSELIFVTAAVLLGVALRSLRWVTIGAVTGLAVFVFLLPFLNARKTRLDEFQDAPFDFFIAAERISMEDRLLEFSQFVAMRLNQGRDLAHVLLALETGALQPIGGTYYENLGAQLIPRVLWPDKPSFNQEMGFELPRRIGLVGSTDEWTSWGVGLLGELAYAHGAWVLVPAVPLMLLVLLGLERLARTIRWKVPEFEHVLGACFLFLFISPGSPINLGTYVLWLFIFAYIADWIAAATRSVGAVAGPRPRLSSPAHRLAHQLPHPARLTPAETALSNHDSAPRGPRAHSSVEPS